MQEPTHAFDPRGQSKALGALAPGSQAEIAGTVDTVAATSCQYITFAFYSLSLREVSAENVKNIENSYPGHRNDDMLLCAVAVLPFSK